MGKVVNAQADAYSRLDKLGTIHQTVLSEIASEITEIKNLLGERKGFYAADTNQKINCLLNTLEKELVPMLKTTFETSEKKLEKMEKVFQENDKF